MTPDQPDNPVAMTALPDLTSLLDLQPDSTISRTVLRAQGVRAVLFGFDAGQELSEHTAAVPILLQVLDGRLTVTADGHTTNLAPHGLIHIAERVPHAIVAVEPSRMLLLMLDPRTARDRT